MKNSVLNKGLRAVVSLLILLPLLISCSVSLRHGYKRYIPEEIPVLTSWFPDDSSHMLFNTSIDVMKLHYSGLMVVKATGRDTFRVVMITEVGLKVFDFEFIPRQDVKVHYIMDPVNRKILINTLANDIRLIMMNDVYGITPAIMKDKQSGNLVLKYKVNDRKAYYFFKPNSSKPYLVIQTGCLTNKVRGEIFGNSAIDSIRLSHYNFKLAIDLHKITEEPYAAE